MTERRALPSRRQNTNFKLRILTEKGSQALYLTVGFFEDSSVAEIFVTLNKTGTANRGYVDSMARSVSLGLQHGVPLSEYVEMFTGTQSSPKGYVKDYPSLRNCQGPIDLVFKVLGIEYCGMDYLVQVRGDDPFVRKEEE